MAGFYQPAHTRNHSSVLVDGKLYLWAGLRDHIPKVHSSDEKLRATSFVDVFECSLGMWEKQHTTGTPLPGVDGYASCSSGTDIYYFGGYCGHDSCYHNSLFCLSTARLVWDELVSNTEHTCSRPMQKAYGALLAFDDQLLAFGGRGEADPSHPSPLAKYEKDGVWVFTNEHHLFDLKRADWTFPNVTGDIPPPMDNFSFTKISSKQAALFGGFVAGSGSNSDLRLATVSRNSVDWQNLVPHGPDRPRGRSAHAATYLKLSPLGLEGNLLLILGGLDITDSWICDLDSVQWNRINNMPDKVTRRYCHSISAVGVSDSCIWLLVIGGYVPGATHAFPSIALVELKHPPKGHCEVTSVRGDQEVYPHYAERFSHTFPALMSAHVHKQQQQIGSLGRELIQLQQESQQSHQQLKLSQEQNAEKERKVEHLSQQLTENSKERARLTGKVDMLNKMARAKDLELDQLQLRVHATEDALFEKKETIMTYESECAKHQAQMKGLEAKSVEKDTLVAKYKAMVKEAKDSLSEKKPTIRTNEANISNLQAKVEELEASSAEKDTLIAKLEAIVKENEASLSEMTKNQDAISQPQQPQEEVKELSLAKESVPTKDSATQANYLFVTGESLRGVEICGETVLEITGHEHQKISWDDFGFHLSVPDGAVSSDVTISLAVKAIMSGPFQLPNDTHLVSSIYWVSGSRDFDKEVSVHIEHCAVISSEEEAANYKFIVGKCSQKNLPYTFKIRDAVFLPQSRLGTINVKQFSFFAAIFRGLWGKWLYMSYCFIKNDAKKPSCWECVFLVTQNLAARVQQIMEKYEDWELHHEAEVEFDEDPPAGEQVREQRPSIALEITMPDEPEFHLWDFYPVTPLQISKHSVDQISTNAKAVIPSCRFAIDWKGPSGMEKPVFKRRVKLKGATSPNNHFTLHIRPSSPPSSPKPSAATATTSATITFDPFSTLSGTVASSSSPLPQERVLDVHDLQEVLSEIKSVGQVQNLGLALGLLVTAVDEIRKDFTSVKEQKIQVIKCWLKRTDIIRKMQSCPPTWSQLADAVAEDDVALSKSIRHKYCTTLQ